MLALPAGCIHMLCEVYLGSMLMPQTTPSLHSAEPMLTLLPGLYPRPRQHILLVPYPAYNKSLYLEKAGSQLIKPLILN